MKESAHTINKRRALRDIEDQLEEDMKSIFHEQGELFLEKLEKYKYRFEESGSSWQEELEKNKQSVIELSESTAEDEFRESIGWEEIDKIMDAVEISTQDETKEVIMTAAENSMEEAATQIITEIGFEIDFDLANPRAVDYLEQVAADKVTQINSTTRGRIATIVTQSAEEGWSYDKTAQKISDRFEEFAVGKPQEHIDSRAHLVAINEASEAYEEANRIVADEMSRQGLRIEKYWSNIGDSKVSDGCQENTDAGWIDLDEEFPSGHQRAPRFPGCRCGILYRRKKTSTR